jgi:predicted secreted Zn-dependent protease
VSSESGPNTPTSVTKAEVHSGMRADAAAAIGLRWRRSTRCSTNSCVEVADLADGGAAIRDTKAGADGPILVFSGEEWRAFVAGVKAGEFD